MTTQLSVPSKSKPVVLRPDDHLHVGIDVHAKSCSIAMWCVEKKQFVREWVPPSCPAAIVASLKPYKAQICRIVYEAGPSGFGLVRALRQEGYCAEVVSAAHIANAPVRGAKCDRLDCRRLAKLSANEDHHPVYTPTPDEEVDRAVVRMQESQTRVVRSIKQRIRAMLLYHGIECPKFSWGPKGLELLGSLVLDKRLKIVLDAHLENLRHGLAQVRMLRKRVAELCQEGEFGKRVRLLETTPGLGLLSSARVAAEMPSPQRFGSARKASKYQGLCAETSRSADTVRDLGHTRSGNPRLRAVLVEAAWSWVRYSEWGAALYARYLRNTGNSKKAIVAVARRLGIILWKMMITGKPYTPPETTATPCADCREASPGETSKAAQPGSCAMGACA